MAMLASSLPAFAQQREAELTLTAHGLTRVGLYYLLDDDVKLPEWLRTERAAQAKAEASMKACADIQKDIDAAERTMEDLDVKRLDLEEKLQKAGKNAVGYNIIVHQIHLVDHQEEEGTKFIAQRQKDLAGIGNASDDYVDTVLKTSDAFEALAARYNALAANDDVKNALDAVNQSGKTRWRLGPSTQFTQELPAIRKLRETVTTAAIKLDFSGGVPEADVTLNGMLGLKMVVDSGAASVNLTWDTARQLGLNPGPNDPIVQTIIADGKVAPCHAMTLKSVRVGQFTVENVPCLVDSKSVKGSNLLGGTFLRNFSYRMNLASGELRLSQIIGTPATRPAVVIALPPDAATALLSGSEPDDEPAGRATVPDEIALKQARGMVHELLKEEFADATPQGRNALARKLLSLGLATSDDPTGRYDLLREARDAAIVVGDLDTALHAAGELGRLYQLDPLELKGDVIVQLAPRLPELRDPALLAAHGLLVVEAMARRGMFVGAAPLISVVRQTAAASRNSSFSAAVRARLAATELKLAEFDRAKEAFDKLKIDPNDADANLAAGRFHCLVRDDFPKGLPLLAKGSNGPLRSAATLDLAQPADAAGRLSAGNAWWELAAGQPAEAADRCRRRAGYWYQLAQPELDGLERKLVDTRLAAIGAASAEAPARVGSVPPLSGVDEDLTRKLNDLNEWDVRHGAWHTEGERIRGEGDTEIQFKSPLPADCVLSMRLNVVSGMRPRIHLLGTGIMFGNEGYQKTLFPYGVNVTDGNKVPYKNGQEVALVFHFSGKQFTVDIDGQQAFAGARKMSDAIHLKLQGGDWWSRGTTEFWDLRLQDQAVAPLSPSAPPTAKQTPTPSGHSIFDSPNGN